MVERTAASMRSVASVTLFALATLGLSQSCKAKPHPLERLTDGRQIRMTWIGEQGEGQHSRRHDENMCIMALDTRDGKGERVVVKKPGTYLKPLISPDGKSIYYTDESVQGGAVMRVPWNGGTPARFASGYLLETWRRPGDGSQWVILAESRVVEERRYRYNSIQACRSDNPGERINIWKQTKLTRDNFQLSRDGRAACGLVPWPTAALLAPQTDAWRKQGTGCWTSMCPDNSYIMWIFDEAHKGVDLYRADGDHLGRIDFSNIPGLQNNEYYHARWSNHPRIICITGPYERTPIRSIGDGHNVEIYIGQLSADLKRVETWLQATDNNAGDYMPDIWVEGGDTATSAYPQTLGRQLESIGFGNSGSAPVTQLHRTFPDGGERDYPLFLLWAVSP